MKKVEKPTRGRNRELKFADYPDFRPNLTPNEIFSQGAFGGTYWRKIKSGVTGKTYEHIHKAYPDFKDIDEKLLSSSECNKSFNKYGVTSGTSLEYWEKKGWIKPSHPYGWMHWYADFYNGHRCEDDQRQIDRWLAFAGPKGRFSRRLINLIKTEKKLNDYSISPVIRQGLHQWAKVITKYDLK